MGKLQTLWQILMPQLSQPKPNVLLESKGHTADLEGVFPDLAWEVQWLFSTSSCKILKAWLPHNEHLTELR